MKKDTFKENLRNYFIEAEEQWLDLENADEYKKYLSDKNKKKHISYIEEHYDDPNILQLFKDIEENLDDYEWAIDQYLDNEDYIFIEIIEILEKHYNLKVNEIIENKVYQIKDYYFEKDEDSEEYHKFCEVDDIENHIESMGDDEILKILGIEEDEVYISFWECKVKELQENPPTVYHYTREENWEEIQESGELQGYSGTGLGNTLVSGVFTSLSHETNISGTYGNVCLEIDLARFKQDQGLEKIDLFPEPEVLSMEIQNNLKSYFNNLRPTEISQSSGISDDTVILGENIPIEYITAEIY